MKNLKYLVVLLVASSYELVTSDVAPVWAVGSEYAEFQARVFNKTGRPIKVILGGREKAKGTDGSYYTSFDEVGKSEKKMGDAFPKAKIIEVGKNVLIKNSHDPRTVFIWTSDNLTSYYEADIAFYAITNKLDLYVYWDATNKKPYVAVWNMNLLQPVFPNGLTKNADGSVKDIDKITPGSTSPTAWNGDVAKQMLTMYNTNIRPDTNG